MERERRRLLYYGAGGAGRYWQSAWTEHTSTTTASDRAEQRATSTTSGTESHDMVQSLFLLELEVAAKSAYFKSVYTDLAFDLLSGSVLS